MPQSREAVCSPSAGLRAVDLRCNGQVAPLAVGHHAPRLSWVLRPAGARGHKEASPALRVQAAYRVRVTDGPDRDTAHGLWDSGRVEGSQNLDVGYRGLPLREGSRFWWWVRVWGADGAASPWSEAASFESGLVGRRDVGSVWIGPSENTFADPLPLMGDWIAPPVVGASGDDEGALTGVIDLPDGYPRCFGMCWISADRACTVELNGHLLENPQPLATDRSVAIGLPWMHLKKGRNVLAVRGPAAALGRGVSFLARIHEAASGKHFLRSGPDWACWGSPVQLLGGRPPASQPADNGPRRAVEMKRTFRVDAVPDAARMRVTGLGTYEVFVNGQRVGRDLLAPGWTEFDRRLHFGTHDVTDLLKHGENEVRAVLGNGWWSSGMGWESVGRASHPHQSLRLMMHLDARDAEGVNTELAATDGEWLWRPAGILHDTIYHGQTEDLRANGAPWRPVLPLDDSFAPSLQPSESEPIRVTDELTAQSIAPMDQEGDAGGWLLDFGQNHAGRPRLRVDVPAGTRLTLRHCEELDADGKPYFENYRTASVTDTVIAGDPPLDWSPCFTYRGYRYAMLAGLPEGMTPGPETLVSQVLHNDAPSASTFSCSNPLLNQIDHALRWGLRSNLHSVPTDCPQRDERLGWTGDVQLFARTSCWLTDLRNFYRKWLHDLFDCQAPDGGLSHVAPFTPVLPRDAAPVWADIITVLPDVLHSFYGDRSLLERAYEPMKRWVGWFEAQAVEGLALVGGFGDWVPVEETPPELCGAAYYAFSSRIVARTARELGCDVEAERYDRQADQAGAAFHKHYFDAAKGHYEPNTQTAQILPLMFDLTPEPLRQRVADHLSKLVADRGDKPSTGFVGTAYLLPVLSRFGHHELAYRVLDTREYPSLGYMVEHGATTIWERWNSDKEGPDMNSRNHFCLGAMGQWIYEDLVGLRADPDVSGFRRVLLTPRPAGDLKEASFVYQSAQGPIDIKWEITDGELVYDVTLPPNVTAELRLPTSDPSATQIEGPAAAAGRRPDAEQHGVALAVFELGPGTHRFATPMPRLAAAPTARVS